MKIKKLIQIFEELIPEYQKAVDENWDYHELVKNNMESGICMKANHMNYDIYQVIEDYYHNLFIGCYTDTLFYTANHLRQYKTGDGDINYIKSCIKPRLKFLKDEVKDLNRLLKEGYTHI